MKWAYKVLKVGGPSIVEEDTWRAIRISLTCTLEESTEHGVGTGDMQNIEEVVRIETPVLLVIQSFILNQGGRVVLGRTAIVCYSSWFLNTASWSFHMVVARNTGWQGGAWENTEFSVYKLVLV
jgi:hypothetical protein